MLVSFDLTESMTDLCIHSASLCPLLGVFSPFTFKVIIDKYDPVTTYIVVWGSFL